MEQCQFSYGNGTRPLGWWVSLCGWMVSGTGRYHPWRGNVVVVDGGVPVLPAASFFLMVLGPTVFLEASPLAPPGPVRMGGASSPSRGSTPPCHHRSTVYGFPASSARVRFNGEGVRGWLFSGKHDLCPSFSPSMRATACCLRCCQAHWSRGGRHLYFPILPSLLLVQPHSGVPACASLRRVRVLGRGSFVELWLSDLQI